MKKKATILISSISLILVSLLLAETLLVKVQTTVLRKSPQFYATVIGSLKYGDQVEKIAEENGWVKVKTADQVEGWLHSSAVETKKIRLLAMNQILKTEASSQEVALAGKGFTKELEKAYREKNKGLNYAAVDKMLRVKVSLADLKKFLQEGKLGEWSEPR
ncbi:MAG: hypothetical protein B5M54_09575 [Candidatus Aminicenantes bacterium 4484_214]|nr:MAG: hypothetical protein B5M54_09575 [Candidatus Aminicenantes bacterium 4484_214]